MKKILTLVAALAATICCMAAKPVQLSLNLEKGKTYGWSSKSSSSVSQNVFGQSIDVTVEMHVSLQFRVDKADAAGYDMTVWYESLKIQTGGMTEMTIDSEEAIADGPLSMAIKAMTKKSFTVKMARSGKIIAIGGIDEMADAVVDELEEKFPSESPEKLEQIKTILKQAYAEQSFKGNLEMGMVILPEARVSPGDTWTNNTQIQSLFSLDLKTVFTLVEKTADGYLIKAESVMATDDNDGPVDMSGLPAKYKLTGTMTSETVIDPSSGWIVSGKTAQDIAGNVEVLESEQLPSGLSIPMIMKTDMTVSGR